MNTNILLNKVREYSNELETSYHILNKDIAMIEMVRVTLKHTDDTVMREMDLKLKKQLEKLEESRRKLKQLMVGIEKILKLYEQCEESIVDYGEGNIASYFTFTPIDLSSLWRVYKTDNRGPHGNLKFEVPNINV